MSLTVLLLSFTADCSQAILSQYVLYDPVNDDIRLQSQFIFDCHYWNPAQQKRMLYSFTIWDQTSVEYYQKKSKKALTTGRTRWYYGIINQGDLAQ